jgi:hypothetical protein
MVQILDKMRSFNIFYAVLLLFATQLTFAQEQVKKEYYGKKFTVSEKPGRDGAVFKNLSLKDSVQTQLVGEIKEVCQVKGCWMKVKINTDDEVFVRFKDYGFFVPADAADKKVYMDGIAFLEEMSVDDQKHYAKDSGASQEEIDKIMEPKRILRYEAAGVLIEE